MAISISKRPYSFKAWDHAYFEPREPNIRGFTDIITSSVWSPIIWKDGHRAEDDYLSCKYMVLDIDANWTLKEAYDFVQANNYSAIIGTTKSHQKIKKKENSPDEPACDRFRLIMPFEREIKDLATFRYNMYKLMHIDCLLPADPAAKDGARFFYPCKDIYKYYLGNPFPVYEIDKEYLEAEKEKFLKSQEKLKIRKDGGVLPTMVSELLTFGPPNGWTRNTTCYKISLTLFEHGWDTEAVYNVLQTTPYLKTLPTVELERTITSARQKLVRQQDQVNR